MILFWREGDIKRVFLIQEEEYFKKDFPGGFERPKKNIFVRADC